MSQNAILEAMRQSLTGGDDGQMKPGVLAHIMSFANIGGANILRAASGAGQQLSLSLQSSIVTSIQNIVGGERLKKRVLNIFGSKGPAKLPKLSNPEEAQFLSGESAQIRPARLQAPHELLTIGFGNAANVNFEGAAPVQANHVGSGGNIGGQGIS